MKPRDPFKQRARVRRLERRLDAIPLEDGETS